MKKVFVDVYMAFNLGDDLFLDILARKYPNCEFTLNYLGNNYDEFISQYQNMKRRKYTIFNKIEQRLKIFDHINNFEKIAEDHDALVFIGGSIFREEDYHHSLYQERMKLVMEFKRRDKSVIIIGANFGPFKTEKFHNDYKELFKQCDDVCFRDLYSYELFKNLSQVRYAPDIVFQMNVDEYKAVSSKKRVGFSIIDVRHKNGLSNYYDAYITNTIKSIELFAKRGYECYLMSFCEREGDLQVIKSIESYLSPDTLKNVFIYNYNGDLKEAINLIATYELLVAARFHANIIALLLGIGVMPIIYSKKTTDMLTDINLNNILIKMEELHLQCDENTINKSFDNKANLTSISHDSKDHFEKISKLLKV
ncbi:polysaccharide pyruvyl transferase family protein [Paenibacillus sp. LMG 31460]|uniref:Polysaccharide pyruvyl transferase family protein n=1 Tax=Paenibacillus germinis TaxID=2654979 RepID=A0ABX1Z7B4_9BACL|nr:polysaccharide pyruvyl transferase family protein [Paenibacillus germinis]NOU87841.1 polysaccharide pyruvyl transferase family protein [Paenibacillus germinis]